MATTTTLSVLTCTLLLTGCGILLNEDVDTVWVEGWESRPGPNGEILEDYPEKSLESLARKKNIGIAVSGGGVRSGAAFSGQLRGLQHLGLLQDVRYLSCVSGGSWAAVPYVFYGARTKHKGVSLDQFLGEYIPPNKLTKSHLTQTTKQRGYPALDSLNACILNGAPLSVTAGLAGSDENYAALLNSRYLTPLGIGDRNTFFTHDAYTLDRAIRKNGSDHGTADLCKGDFYVATTENHKPPFLITNGYLTNLQGKAREDGRQYHFEMTPYYSGVRRLGEASVVRRGWLPNSKTEPYSFGGGIVESYGYDTLRPAEKKPSGEANSTLFKAEHFPNKWKWVHPRFSLSDMIGTSGAAPTIAVSWLSNIVGFSEFLNWSPQADNISKQKQTPIEFRHTDAGAVDNLGLLALLAREVDTAIVFVNCTSGVAPTLDGCGNLLLHKEIRAYFQEECGGQSNLVGGYKACHVFQNTAKENEKSPLGMLQDQLKGKIIKGEPLVAVGDYTTKQNLTHQVKGGHKVKVIWFFLGGKKESDKSSSDWTARTTWFNQMPPETRAYIAKKTSKGRELRNFPFYGTFSELQISEMKAAALSSYTSHQVVSSEDILRKAIR